MINNSLTAILFQWENVSSESLILEVEPPVGELSEYSFAYVFFPFIYRIMSRVDRFTIHFRPLCCPKHLNRLSFVYRF